MAPLAPFRSVIWPHGGRAQVRPAAQGHPAVTPPGTPDTRVVESHRRMRDANGQYKVSGNISLRDKNCS